MWCVHYGEAVYVACICGHAFLVQHGYLPLVSGKELEHSCCETNARNVKCFAVVHAPHAASALPCMHIDLRAVKFYGCASSRRTRVSYPTELEITHKELHLIVTFYKMGKHRHLHPYIQVSRAYGKPIARAVFTISAELRALYYSVADLGRL